MSLVRVTTNLPGVRAYRENHSEPYYRYRLNQSRIYKQINV